MNAGAPTKFPLLRDLGLLLALVALVFGLRWTTFRAAPWNVDETIHAAVGRVLQDGGVLYRDAIDQRGPLTYHVVAAVFGVAGENNLAAVRAVVAALIAGTAFSLFLALHRRGGFVAGLAAALLYAVFSSTALYSGDAYAIHTEWFLAFFSSAAAATFLAAPAAPSARRLFATGLLLGAAFLSKQPGLLDAAAPAVVVAWLAGRGELPARHSLRLFAAFAAGWFAPVAAALAWFAAHHALRDAIFYAWTYNVSYYGPEITTAERLHALRIPFQLFWSAGGVLVIAWAGALLTGLLRLIGRGALETAARATVFVYVAIWSLTALAGSASGGRDFEHYTIQFLPAFCAATGLALGALARAAAGQRNGLVRGLIVLAGVSLLVPPARSLGRLRGRAPIYDPTVRVSQYIREHSDPADRIFVWGFQSEIYFNSDRRPASRFVYCSFLTGLIPWTNVAPERDTRYAIVPGAMTQLLQDLAAHPPRFIVDCSVGPNRHWEKYPPDNFPELQRLIRQNYRQVEPHVFLHQGFRLYQRLTEAELAARGSEPTVPAEVLASLDVDGLRPVRAAGLPGGLYRQMGVPRREFFAHAPSSITYRLPATIAGVSGSFGIRPQAFAANNPGPTDGAEFIVRWRPDGGAEQVLLRRLLRPRDEPADRTEQTFQFALSPHAGGEIEFIVEAGPADNNASDWAIWTGLAFRSAP